MRTTLILFACTLAATAPAEAQQAKAAADIVRVAEVLRVQSRREWNRFPSLYPVARAEVTSEYARNRAHPVNGAARPHYGIDLRARTGTPILAAAEGRVIAATRTPDYGLALEVDHGNGYVTRYAHASRLLVKTGNVVRRGQTIALSGATGRVSGPHLHYEIFREGWSVNPCLHLLYPAIGAEPATPPC